MRFEFSEKDAAFRLEVRQFLQEHLPADIAARTSQFTFGPDPADMVAWNKILFRKGWVAPHWPVEWGGTGWSAMQCHIFDEECARANAPTLPMQGLTLVAPVIYTYGTQAQKERFLKPILAAEDFWAQGFSEPNAGSDLASLRTTAILEGDHYRVNGQKIWTSEAHCANWGFFLVKTDTTSKPQRSISFLLIAMNTPGITVRPIRDISGRHLLNEVFLKDVIVPADHLVGEAGKGWEYAKFLLANERTASAFIHYSKQQVAVVKAIAAKQKRNGESLMKNPTFRYRLAQVEIDLLALEMSVLRVLAKEDNPENPTAVASGLKIRGAELQQRVTELQVDAFGWKSLRYFPEPCFGLSGIWDDAVPGRAGEYLMSHASTIYGGARDVQKNIIAKLAFGL